MRILLKQICLILFYLLTGSIARAQELFVFTEPASNMASKSLGLRMNTFIMKDDYTSRTNYHLVPELMIGVSKKIMLHGDVFISNQSSKFAAEGGSIYLKYRLLSSDEVQKHFRISAFGRASYNNSDIHQEDINIYGHNSGWEVGAVATKLIYKTAISSGLSFVKGMDNGSKKFYSPNKAINYTISVGRLLFPKIYKDYNQTNLNVMLELLNQLNVQSGKYYTDIASALQLIIYSQARLDVGYRSQISSTYARGEKHGFLIRLEYNLFNAY